MSSPTDLIHISTADPATAARPPAQRHDAITPERRRRFLEALAATGSVSEAARQAGASRQSFYALRARNDQPDFCRAWDYAMAGATQILADAAYERAIDGVEEPVYWRGELVGTRRRYNDALLLQLLRVRDPHQFAPLPDLRGLDRTLTPIDGPNFDALLDRIAAAPPGQHPSR